ncbi:polysaccharide lyase family 1 protein [Thalassotalea sp. PS06]|uniref:pectate lyase family protein n=1 Tax=Thalassotalea sp. PS06 TaxID=2594005 RepID=UPI0011633F92|nr:hypothetical protein [Thalassotalea sp. PS06]QDP02301.1 hypothetical protein FNC98_13685 [Thalassotalea sp. PS06]
MRNKFKQPIIILFLVSFLTACSNDDEVSTDENSSAIVQKPDAFSFAAKNDQPRNTLISSESITISGITSKAEVNVNNGEYSINQAAFTKDKGFIENGDTLALRVLSSNNYGETTSATVNVGGVEASFEVTTENESLDSVPEPFSFNNATEQTPSSQTTSNTITVTGINTATPIRIVGGEYKVNGGAFVSSKGTVNNGDTVKVRVQNSTDFNSTVAATLFIGDVSAEFRSTTGDEEKQVASLPFQGFVGNTTGGAGGKVIKVTNLNTSGPGSLQDAIDQPGARIVVFDVSGVIDGDITINHGDLTIAGQTAPGTEGVTLHGHLYTRYIRDPDNSFGNIIVQHIRVRPPLGRRSQKDHDAIQFSSNNHVILDHVSTSHASDENIDFYSGAKNITVQWSIISFPRETQTHKKGNGLLNGPGGGLIAVHHNLFAHNRRRAPAIAYGPADIRNNVVYNSKEATVHHNPADGEFNIIGNYYIDGPSETLLPIWLDPENSNPQLTYYSFDNYVDDPNKPYTGTFSNPFLELTNYNFYLKGVVTADMFDNEQPIDFSKKAGYEPITTDSSTVAYQRVLKCAGAFPRDAIDTKAINDVMDRTGKYNGNKDPDLFWGSTSRDIDSEDSDNDGMLNTFEQENGLDPNDPNDIHTTLSGGRSAIETFLEQRAIQIMGNAEECFE